MRQALAWPAGRAWRAGALLWSRLGLVRVADGLRGWAEAERGRFALWLPVCMGAGTLDYFARTTEPAPWTGAALLAAALALTGVARWGRAGEVLLRGAGLALVAAALGFAAAQFATWTAPAITPLPTAGVAVTGVVRLVESMPKGGPRLTLAEVRLGDAPPLPRRIRVRLRPDDTEVPEPGAVVTLRAMVRPPPPPAFPGAWDLQRDAYFSGLASYGYALGPVQVVAPAAGGGIGALRHDVDARIRAALPGTAGAIAATVLTGLPGAIPEADRAAFRDAGLAHLLAVAGLHVGVVMGLALCLVRFALACSEHASLHWPCKQIAVLAALAAGLFYLLLTGGHVPIIRSFAMACLVALGVLTGRRAVSLRGLALAAVVLLLISPEEVTGVSLQMSFSAVLALIAGYEALRPVLTRLRGEGGPGRRLLVHAVMLAVTSLLAGTASLPFAAAHFGRIQLYYVLGNLVAVPITALWVMPAGLLSLPLMPLGLERLALRPMGWGIDAVLWIAHAVADLPGAALQVPHMPGWGLATLGFGLAWLGLWRSRARLLGVLPILTGLASAAWFVPPDLLVSANARLIGLRTGQGVFIEAARPVDSFTLDAWAQLWPGEPVAVLPHDGQAGGIACDAAACRIGGAAPVLLVRDPRAPVDCRGIVLLVSPEPLRRTCPEVTARVDRFTVWRDGAQAIRLDARGPQILSDRAARGDRPWVPPLPVPHRQDAPAQPEARREPVAVAE